MTVLVCDGDQRSALAITRSLGARGVKVLVGEARQVSLASASRHCAGHVMYPSPETEPDAFEHGLLDLIARHSIDAIVPVSDVTTHMIAKHRDAIQQLTGAAVPAVEAVDFISDKSRLMRHALRLGVPIPCTHFVADGRDLERPAEMMQFPVVLKPFRSRIRSGPSWFRATVHYAASRDELRRLYRRVPYLAAFPSLIQERVTGEGVGLSVLFDAGRLVTAFAHRRIREKPPSGGVGVLCESIPLDPELCDYAVRLLAPVAWHGVAMVEFKRDPRRGVAVLMEINGRFWGSTQLAVDAGVDFPFMAVQLARHQVIEPPASYRAGVRSRWWLGDLDQLLSRLRGVDCALPASQRSRLTALREFLRPRRSAERCDVFRLDDMRPMCRELRDYAGALVESLSARGRARHQVTTVEEDPCLYHPHQRIPARRDGDWPNSTNSRSGVGKGPTSTPARAVNSTGTNGAPTN